MANGLLSMEEPEEGMHPLDKLAIATIPWPVVGDAIGLAADTRHMVNDPSWANAGFAALGLLPWVPHGAALRKGKEGLLKLAADDPMAEARRLGTEIAEEGRFAPTDLDPIGDVSVAKPKGTSGRVGTTGKYSGAPRGINSPQKLGALRNRLYKSLERGMPGRDWYDRSSASALDLTGHRPNLRDRYSLSMAETSQGANVGVNQGFGIKAHNQMLTGSPIDSGRFPAGIGTRLEASFGGNPRVLPPKVGPFYQAQTLTPDMAQQGIRPTNDIWMGRAFGFTKLDPKTGEVLEWSEGFGNAQHRFMDDEIGALTRKANEQKLGGFDDWTPEKVQAAIWVDTKAAKEGTTIGDAARDFSDRLEPHTVRITTESQPAESLEHMTGLLGTERGVELLTDLQRKALQNEQGQSIGALQLGLLTRPASEGYNVYNRTTNPATATEVLGGTKTKSQVMDDPTESLVRAEAASQALLKGQETAGINFLRPWDEAAQRNAVKIPLPSTRENVLALEEALGRQFDDAQKMFAITHGADGSIILGINKLPEGWERKMQGISEELTGYKPALKKSGGDFYQNTAQQSTRAIDPDLSPAPGLLGEFGEYKPSTFLREIDAAPEAATRLDAFLKQSAGTLNRIDKMLEKVIPDAGTRSELLTTTRRILSESGLEGLREAVRQGIIPAVVLTALGLRATNLENRSAQTERYSLL